jgi:dihydrodipicolinate synthase/N-acetylneuraminate lyase
MTTGTFAGHRRLEEANKLMLTLNGITPVMASSFTADGAIDDAPLRAQIDWAIAAGAAAVCGPGFGAEFYKMSDSERYHFVDVLIDQTRNRVPVIAATSCGSTYNTIEFSRYAERAGADCLMVTAPRSAPLPAAAIIEFYSRLCDAVTIPVMLQDADFTGAGLPAAVFVDLAKRHQNFRFAKLEVTLPGAKCAEIVERSSGQVQVIYGLGGIAMLDGLEHGASAMMPGAACLEVYVRTYQLYMQGERQSARELFHRMVPYLAFALQHLEVAIHIEKRVLVRRGVLPNSSMRHPTITLDESYQHQMDMLVESVVGLAEECRANMRAAV